MTKYYFKNANELMRGIEILAPDRSFTIATENDADIIVDIEKSDENISEVSLDGKNAKIKYGIGSSRFFRALSHLIAWNKDGITKRSVTERPIFDTNGAMVDMSRNAVMNVETVKFMLRKMALMGLNTYMLYTEDTYEIENRPYFGYMRGRYTKSELRELDRYALDLGIELIPCIQLLGHLATHLRWAETRKYKDTANALLVGADETYSLISDMLKTISECFTSKRLHMGMDETHDLGTGAYLDKNGYRERSEIFLEHLNRVTEMATAMGFKPMMWSDMFFRLAGKDIPDFVDYDMRTVISDDIKSKIPEGIQHVFWDYYHPNEDFYAVNIEKHKSFCKNTVFAGGIWLWSSLCPHYSASDKCTYPALDACKKGGIKEIIATVWLNGAEGSLILGIPGLSWFADYDYKGCRDENGVRECFKNATGLCYDDFMALELPELPHGSGNCISKALTYNDPLIGLIDRHIGSLDTVSYYQKTSARLSGIAKTETEFDPAIDTVKALCSLLENKANFGVRLKAAYDSGDKAKLSEFISESDVIIEKLKQLRIAHKNNWYTYNKPFGWEVHDIRYGALIMRFETVKERLSELICGKITHIEELDAERLRINCTPDESEPFNGNFLWLGFPTTITVSRL